MGRSIGEIGWEFEDWEIEDWEIRRGANLELSVCQIRPTNRLLLDLAGRMLRASIQVSADRTGGPVRPHRP